MVVVFSCPHLLHPLLSYFSPEEVWISLSPKILIICQDPFHSMAKFRQSRSFSRCLQYMNGGLSFERNCDACHQNLVLNEYQQNQMK